MNIIQILWNFEGVNSPTVTDSQDLFAAETQAVLNGKWLVLRCKYLGTVPLNTYKLEWKLLYFNSLAGMVLVFASTYFIVRIFLISV